MPRKNSYKNRAQVSVDKIYGLSSKPDNIAPIDRLVSAKNFYFNSSNILKSREGSSIALAKFDDNKVEDVVEITNSTGVSKLLYTTGRRLTTFDGLTTRVALEYNSSTDILSATTNVRRLTAFKDHGYAVDGTDKLYKVDVSSGTVTQLTIPESATYGNAVEVFTMFGSLAILTDGGYMRYTAVNSDTVWEERIVLPGTVEASGTTVTGTGTFFRNIIIGTKIIFNDGVNEEIGTVRAVTSNAGLTLTSSLSNTFSSGTNIIMKGLDFQQPLDVGDGLDCRMGIQFGNSVAITKTSPNSFSSEAKLIVLSPLQIDVDTSAMFFKQQNASNAFALHPYSLEDYEDNLIFMTDTGVYLLKPAQQDIDTIKPLIISKDKLETKLRNIVESRRANSRINLVSTGDINSIFISTTVDAVGEYNTILLVGILDASTGEFEFTELRIPTFGDAEDLSTDEFWHSSIIRFSDKIYMFGKESIHEILKANTNLDEVPYVRYFGGSLWDSDDLMSDDIILSSTDATGVKFNNRAISRKLKTGALSNDLFNTQTLYKFYLVVSEGKATQTPSNNSYTVKFNLDNDRTGFITQRVYAPDQNTNVVTCDSTLIKVDNGVVTVDIGALEQIQQAPLEYFSKTNNWTTAALEITDEHSSGTMELRGYGFTLKTSRYS